MEEYILRGIQQALGAGATTAVLLGLAWLWLKVQLKKANEVANDITLIKGRIEELHEWHDREDADGVKVWYVRHSLTEAINRLADLHEANMLLLRELLVEVKRGRD